MRKSISLVHVTAVMLLYYLIDSFCSEVCGTVYFATGALVFSEIILDTVINILAIIVAVFFYARYALNKSVTQLYLNWSYPRSKWCVTAFLFPVAMCAFYFIFTEGVFYRETSSYADLVYAISCTIISIGLKNSVVQELIFRGAIMGILHDSWGRKAAVLISSFLFSLIHLGNIDISEWKQVLLILCGTMIAGIALAMVTIESGSVWSSVVIHGLYNILSGDGLILHINTFRNPWAIWNYVFESDNWLLTGISGVSELETGLPAMIGFAAIAGMAAWSIRKREMGHWPHAERQGTYGKTEYFDHRR